MGRRGLSIALCAASAVFAWHSYLTGNCPAEPWIDARVAGPFICRADFPLSGTDNSLFAELAQLQQDVVRALGIRPASEPIELYLFRDQWTYQRYITQRFPSVPYRRALYLKTNGVGRVFAYRSSQFEVDLRHECTHALIHAALPMVPLWLDEGIAEYFEVSPGHRAFDNPHLNGVRWAARFGMVPHLAALERHGELSQMGGTEYRSAWAWVHFLLHGPPEARDELVRFLSDIQNGNPPGLLSQRLQRRMPDLERRFLSHFTGWRR